MIEQIKRKILQLTSTVNASVALSKYPANFSKVSSITYEIDLSHSGRKNNFLMTRMSSSAIVPRADAVTEACKRLCLELWRTTAESNH